MIRNPTLVALRARECKRESRNRLTASLTDVKYNDKTRIVDKDNTVDSGGYLIRCCKNNKFEVSSNLMINIMVFIVLLAGIVIYAGLSVLYSKLV